MEENIINRLCESCVYYTLSIRFAEHESWESNFTQQMQRNTKHQSIANVVDI